MVSHAVVLRGLAATALQAGPAIVKRTEDDFMQAVLHDAREPSLATLLATRADDRDTAGVLRLFQPVHRVFHLAMFEAVCDMPGTPRLDPAKIDSACMVIRRVASSSPSGTGAYDEAWLTTPRSAVGWRKLASADAARLDPDPARRALPDQGSAAVNQAIARQLGGTDAPAEAAVTLFVAPPDVCRATGKTILFGLIPTASSESGAPEPPDDATAPFSDQDIDDQVPRFLRAGLRVSIDGIAGQTFTFEQADIVAAQAAKLVPQLPPHEHDDPDALVATDDSALRTSKQMHGFVAMLKVLAIQLDAFGDSKGTADLRSELAKIQLTFPGGSVRKADSFLAEAATALVLQPGSNVAVTLPVAWPSIPTGTARSIRKAFAAVLQARFAGFAPRLTRFDDPNARYRIHGFLRVRRDDGCPPELVRALPSEVYTIAAWYDPSGTPPVLVRLPPLGRGQFGKLKPNVAFVVPKNLLNILNRNKPEDLIAGSGKDGGDGGLDWICGFNIPIITLCAFIVLFIFLTLLNIIFWWLPFIRICFPLPRNFPR